MIRVLHLSGGGEHGISILGALNCLEHKLEICEVIGTSVGALIGTLLSICTIDEIISLCKGLDLVNEVHIETLFDTFGICDTKHILSLVSNMMKNKMKNENPSFKELYEYNNIYVSITGTNISLQRGEIFNINNTPNMSVLKALEISISIPLLYESVMHNGFIYSDGGITNMYPSDQCNITKELKAEEILNIYCIYAYRKIDDLTSYIHSLIGTLFSGTKHLSCSNTITITNKIEYSSFQQLYDEGYVKGMEYLRNM